MQIIDDTKLFKQIKLGDTTAASQLIEQWHPMFSGFLARIAGIDDAADIAQDAYLKFFEKFHTFKNVSHARRFMYKTGYNRAIDTYRKKQNHASAHKEIKVNATNINHSSSHHVKHDLHAAIATLPPKEQAVIALKVQHDFTAREIAAHLGIPTGTVLYRIHKALNRMREFLSSHHIQEGMS